jgi:transcriptional regulator with XRE-family HTH domain
MKPMTSTIQATTQNRLSAAGVRWSAQASTNELLNVHGRWVERLAESTAAANAFSGASMPKEWTDVEYRHAAMEATVENLIAWQVRINREERGMTQDQLARAMGTKQPAISKLEDPDGGDVLVSTLVKAAHAFDCALLVRFVEYSALAAHTRDVRPERLYAVSYQQESGTHVAPQRKMIDHGRTSP